MGAMAAEPTTPFAFGRSPAVSPPAPMPLFSPGQVALATLLATPVAGAILVAWNLRRQQRRGALLALGVGVSVIGLALYGDARGSAAVWWLAVPAWTVGASLASSALFASALPLVGRRPMGAAWLVSLATVGALYGAGSLASVLAPRAVPGFGELLFHWIGVGPNHIRWGQGASREDALRVGEALERAAIVRDQARLRVDVAREGDRLVLRIRLPDASPEAMGVARAITRAVAEHLDPADCVTGRIVDVAGRRLAEGTHCP